MEKKTSKISKSKKEATEKILNRISRIEGQMRGLRLMIENEKDCSQIVNQVMAVREAVASLGVEILQDNLVCKLSERKKIDEKYLKNIFKLK